MQRDSDFYGRYFAELFLYLYQYKVKTSWLGLLIIKNRQDDLGSELPYENELKTRITRLYLEDLLHLKDLTPNLALLKLIVVDNSEVASLGKSILRDAENEDEFQRRFRLIEAILKSKLPQLTIEEVLEMFDLKTAKMPELGAYEALVKYWEDKGQELGEAKLLIRLLTRRCGALSDEIQAKVRSLPIPELESLGEALLDFQGMSDLESWFQSKNHENG
jgi:predicted transposase YdaD